MNNLDFNTLREKYGSIIGYHGTALENVHAISRTGLDTAKSRAENLFGEGNSKSIPKIIIFIHMYPFHFVK